MCTKHRRFFSFYANDKAPFGVVLDRTAGGERRGLTNGIIVGMYVVLTVLFLRTPVFRPVFPIFDSFCETDGKSISRASLKRDVADEIFEFCVRHAPARRDVYKHTTRLCSFNGNC